MTLPTAQDFPGAPGAEYDYNPSNNPEQYEQAKQILRISGRKLDCLSNARRAAAEYVEFAELTERLLRDVAALGIASQSSLPPFPLPGDLGPLQLEHLALALEAATRLIKFCQTPITGLGDVSPDTALRRIATAVQI
jgi:hypothetical protein